MNDSLKIIFVIPHLKYGGAELFLLRLCKEICERHKVILVVIGGKDGLYGNFSQLEITLFFLNCKTILEFPRALIALRRIIRREKPEVLQSFLYMADLLAGIASIGLRIRSVIWTLRGTKLAKGTANYKFLIQKLACLLSRIIPNHIISCSLQVQNFHLSRGYPLDKMVCIGNFMPEWVANPQYKSVFYRELSPKKFSIGVAARYVLGKGHLHIAEAIYDFLCDNSDFSIILKFAGKNCGENEDLKRDIFAGTKYHELIRQGRFSIEFHGLIKESGMLTWFEQIDLYYMSSDSLEGFPNSLAEAIALGVPSLSNPVGAAVDFLTGDYLANGFDTFDMSQNLQNYVFKNITLEQRKREAEELREMLLLRYNASRVVNAYELVWQSGSEYYGKMS